jgi:hypothetical protein
LVLVEAVEYLHHHLTVRVLKEVIQYFLQLHLRVVEEE